MAPDVVISAAHCFLNNDETGYVQADDPAVAVATLRADPAPSGSATPSGGSRCTRASAPMGATASSTPRGSAARTTSR
ncbi:MAG: hypothetical protein R3F43_01585 [bacterium]